MKLGEGEAGFLEDITAVYRRSNVGVYMSQNMDEHFMKTRIDHVRWMSGMLDWYSENLKRYPKIPFENRIKHEAYNFLKTALKVDDYQAIINFFNDYPKAAKMSLGAYLSFYADSRVLVKTVSWPGYQLMVRHRYYRQGLAIYAAFLKKIDKIKVKIIAIGKKIANGVKIIKIGLGYWLNTVVPKQKNLWVITSFRRKGYMDNTKYFYEYVCENHPEIDIRWITNDKNVYEELVSNDMPVCLEGTREQRKLLRRAEIAITDHFAMSDFKMLSGINDKTKIIQLWHGVGFKSMGDKDGVKNTNERGVKHSSDILITDGDGLFSRLIKRIKYYIGLLYRFTLSIALSLIKALP